MKLEINNLGRIENCEIELNDLTILVGENNSGKTYVTYCIYGILNHWIDFIKNSSFDSFQNQLKSDGKCVLQQDQINKIVDDSISHDSSNFHARIKDLFNDKEKIFSKAKVKIDFDKPKQFKNMAKKIRWGNSAALEGNVEDNILTLRYIKEGDTEVPDDLLARGIARLFGLLIFDDIFPDPYIITAERLGISLFYKELDARRNSMIDGLQKLDTEEGDIHPFDLIMSMTAYYAEPIQDHVAFTRNLDNIKKNNSKLDISYPLDIIKEMLGAEFKKEMRQDIRFYTRNKRNNKFDIPVYLASSSARCIVDIFFYLKHLSKEGDMLIIDEPESHLTLHNQRLMAKLIVSLVNRKVKVFITTHSDFLVKEINNLILLSNTFEDKDGWLDRNKKMYSSEDSLNYEKLSVYQAIGGTLQKLNVNNKGLQVPFFDDEINSLFSVSSDLEYLVN